MTHSPDQTREIVVGTRGSALALTQTRWVVDTLLRLVPEVGIVVQVIRTEGDVSTKAPLWQIGGRGVFVKEIERALLDGQIDFAVHSMKDLPSTMDSRLALAAVPEREDPRDVWVSRHGGPIEALPRGATVGTSSSRRRAQILALRPDLEIVPLRGNVDTRLRKAETGELDGIVLAAAGLARLGYLHKVTRYLESSVCMPAVGQGALAVQARADDEWLLERLADLDHAASRAEAEAERTFLAEMGGGCQLPMAALARAETERITLSALVASPDGETVLRVDDTGTVDLPVELGSRVAARLKAQGALQLMEADRNDG